MAKLFVANTTRQAHDFAYQIPAEDLSSFKRLSTQRIEAGTQQQIMGEAPLVVLEAIVEQHRRYGIVSAEEAVRTRGFVGLVYSFDRPVDLERMHYALDHNRGVLFEQGEQTRREMAVSIEATFEQELRRPMREVAVELLEERTLTEGSDGQMAQGLRVVHDDALRASGGVRPGRGR